MVPLSTRDIDAYIADPHKKTGDLLKAYKLARDPTVWNEEQNRIVHEHEEFLARRAADPSSDDGRADEDGVGEEDAAPQAKKRKPAARRAEPAKKGRVAPEEATDAVAAARVDEEEEYDPATRKVREWRHRLQRAFLNKDGVIVPEDMENQDVAFKVVEAYTDMTADQLKATKIGKVMKRIHQLADVPRDDEFHFRQRAGDLMVRWGAILGGADREAGGGAPGEEAKEEGEVAGRERDTERDAEGGAESVAEGDADGDGEGDSGPTPNDQTAHSSAEGSAAGAEHAA
ncbi:hypothetical protein MSPP1_003140 [Malassezia sp. CBS 17886]|nr:hypothetical protein MSPP1_003140 [Malassezia sp. CBS 17886]